MDLIKSLLGSNWRLRAIAAVALDQEKRHTRTACAISLEEEVCHFIQKKRSALRPAELTAEEGVKEPLQEDAVASWSLVVDDVPKLHT